jgi:hypothetical protein
MINDKSYIRVDLFTAMKIPIVVFWVVTPCGDVAGVKMEAT